MFKCIKSILSGKKNNTQSGEGAETTNQLDSKDNDQELIAFYDSYGQQMYMTRSEWRVNVLLHDLQQKWNNPDELYSSIVMGLNDDFASDLIPAAERLIEIDNIPERSHVIQGIVLMKNGKLSTAESSLRKGIEKAGATGTLLTNLAKVFAERGDKTQADETLWQAMMADPNQENGLLWWASIKQECDGETGYLTALRAVAALPGSWRAQLWLARHHLEHKEIECARKLYTEVLIGGMFDDSALMMISGDLGNNGEVLLIVELIAPIYNEYEHHFGTGINLLHAYQSLGNAEEGEKLLDRMYSLDLSPIKQQLDQFAQAFQEMDKLSAQAIPIESENIKISPLALTQPIWHYGLCNADWLFKQKPEGTDQVGFFALSIDSDGTQRPQPQREDNLGRMTRAIPLYFAESLHYWTNHATTSYFQVIEDVGSVVTCCETDSNMLFDFLPPTMNYFVTGKIGCSGEDVLQQWQISLTLWDCKTRTKKSTESGQVAYSEIGSLVLKLERFLLDQIGSEREKPLDEFYLRPSAESMGSYLTGLGQAFVLTLVANELIPRTSIWGERAILEWPLNMALQWPLLDVPKLMYLSGLGKAFDYESKVLAEYRQRSQQLLRKVEDTNSPATRLMPLVWKIFGLHEEFTTHLQSLPADASTLYVEWLERLAKK